jgi:tetratricopeptide (TPR) repeat protein
MKMWIKIAFFLIIAWPVCFIGHNLWYVYAGIPPRHLEGETAFQNAGIAQHTLLHDDDKAIEFFNKALRSPKTGHVRQGRWKSHAMLGMIYLNRGDDENALYHFKRALIFNPFDANVHNALAYIMMKREQYDNAESVVKGAISIDPQNEYSLKMFAWLLHRRGAS